MSYTILSTKKLDAPVRDRLEEDGFILIEEAFININKDLSAIISDRIKAIHTNDALVFTSANAVEAVKEYINVNAGFKVFCISGKTKETVEASFKNAIIIDVAASGNQLAEKIIAHGVKQVIFCCGNIRKDVLPTMLTEHNIEVEEIIVYQTIETPKKVSDHFDAVLFFSPSAVKSFFSSNQLNANVVCFSIGTTTEAEIKQFTGNIILVADGPTQESLTIQIKKHFKPLVQS